MTKWKRRRSTGKVGGRATAEVPEDQYTPTADDILGTRPFHGSGTGTLPVKTASATTLTEPIGDTPSSSPEATESAVGMTYADLLFRLANRFGWLIYAAPLFFFYIVAIYSGNLNDLYKFGLVTLAGVAMLLVIYLVKRFLD